MKIVHRNFFSIFIFIFIFSVFYYDAMSLRDKKDPLCKGRTKVRTWLLVPNPENERRDRF